MEKDNINNIKLDNLNLEDNPEVKKSNKDYILLEQFKLKNLTNIKDLDELNSILTKTENF